MWFNLVSRILTNHTDEKTLFMLQNEFLNGNFEISHYCLSHVTHFWHFTWFTEGAELQYGK